jgi:CheY-like chemotaxis protein
MNGWKVLEHIRQESAYTRVIIITSSDDRTIRQDAIRKGAYECLGKPFDLDELKCVLMNAISMQRYHRVQKTFPVSFGNECKGLVCNLSSTGMLIFTDFLCECGTTLDITLDVAEEEMIPLKGQVVRTVESVSKTSPSLSDGWKLPENMNYGLGIKLLEQPPLYSSLVNSLLF